MEIISQLTNKRPKVTLEEQQRSIATVGESVDRKCIHYAHQKCGFYRKKNARLFCHQQKRTDSKHK